MSRLNYVETGKAYAACMKDTPHVPLRHMWGVFDGLVFFFAHLQLPAQSMFFYHRILSAMTQQHFKYVFLPQNFVSNDSAAFLFKRSRRIQMTFPLGESQLYFENLTFKGTAAANSSRNQTRAGLSNHGQHGKQFTTPPSTHPSSVSSS